MKIAVEDDLSNYRQGPVHGPKTKKQATEPCDRCGQIHADDHPIDIPELTKELGKQLADHKDKKVLKELLEKVRE